MTPEWITSPTARRILAYWADPRPAWLWSRDGNSLLWRNGAARLFNGRVKKSGIKLAPDPVPIKGLVARLIRLGAPGRPSLSRVQFLSGGKPVAATCLSTPLTLWDDEPALLLVAVDPVSADVLESTAPPVADSMTMRLLPSGARFALVRDGAVIDGDADISIEPALRVPADDRGTELLVYVNATPAPAHTIEDARDEEGVAADDIEQDLADTPEPLLPLGLEPVPEAIAPPLEPTGEWVPHSPPPEERSLSSLFDRLAEDSELFTQLTAADEALGGLPPAEPAKIAEADPVEAAREPDLIASLIEYADDPEANPQPASSPSQWMITGRGFRALTQEPAAPEPPQPAPEEPVKVTTVDAAPDAETAQRVSRYNFEELGRILSDRVSGEEPVPPEPPAPPRATPQGVINLSAETLVLNRLPLAILVFRDQQVLFANRALTDLLGHDGVESLRSAGIASIFPSEEAANAGPVNRLVRRDGTPLAVTARLQSVSWQGRAALMLSASPAEQMRGHEGAVRAFAEIAADARHDGFIAADRAGLVTEISPIGASLLGGAREDIVGRPLAILVTGLSMDPLRVFLEKPARFAETARPSFVAQSETGDAEIALFAEGQAGTVTGYFGFIRKRGAEPSTPASEAPEQSDPAMFGRLSRGIRRPLNTIIGFADLIRSAALGSIDAGRYVEYARDIRTAGLEIAVLVDELDDYARLRGGSYEAQPADVELGALLESCVQRVKAQAGAARVLVRSAVAERLPRVRADRTSLGQALLNLLASAIDQTPIGGSVILSAQLADDGGISVHVRDGSPDPVDMAERFVVFRDGVDKDGEQLQPVRSSVGLALTRSLLAVNACSLSIDPVAGAGTLFSLLIPGDLITKA